MMIVIVSPIGIAKQLILALADDLQPCGTAEGAGIATQLTESGRVNEKWPSTGTGDRMAR